MFGICDGLEEALECCAQKEELPNKSHSRYFWSSLEEKEEEKELKEEYAAYCTHKYFNLALQEKKEKELKKELQWKCQTFNLNALVLPVAVSKRFYILCLYLEQF